MPGATKRRTWKWALAIPVIVAGMLAGWWIAPRLKPHVPPHFRQLTYRLGMLTGARFAPSGGGVLYSAFIDSKPQVFAAQPGNAEPRLLSAQGTSLADVSPRGELALILSNRPGPGGGMLARAPLAGGAPRPILDNVTYASWAPNGEDLMVVHIVGGKRRVEFPIGHVLVESDAWRLIARLSPQGDRIALVEVKVPSYLSGHVEVMDLGGKRRTLTSEYPSINSLAWSADGREIWFGAGESRLFARKLKAVGLDGKLRDVTEFPFDFVLRDLAGDGRALISVETFHHRIAGLLPDSDHERDLSWFEGSDLPELSPDGKRLLTTVLDDPASGSNVTYLREGGSAVKLGLGNALALSPDGNWALTGRGPMFTDLELQPTGPGSPRSLPHGKIELIVRGFFFPDGKRLLLVGREANRPFRLWQLGLAGGDPTPLSEEGVITACPPSPDEKWVAAYQSEQAFLLPVAGGSPQPLGKLPKKWLPIAWSEDGLFVRKLEDVERLDGYVSTGVPVEIQRFDLKSGALTPWRRLVPGEPAGHVHIDNVSITPDGKSYAYAYAGFAGVLFLAEGLR
jgi:hypothetical protein